MNKTITNPIASLFKYLAISILFAFTGGVFGQLFIPKNIVYFANQLFFILIVIILILCIFSRKNRIPRSFSMNWVYLFTFIDGLLLYPLIQMYLHNLGIHTVASVLLGTIAILTVLSIISNKKTPGHYLKLGPLLFYSLITLLFFSLLSIFIGSTLSNLIISVVGIIIFSGYILYDVSRFKLDMQNNQINEKNDLSIHVLNLYLNFINIFLYLLNLVGIFNSND